MTETTFSQSNPAFAPTPAFAPVEDEEVATDVVETISDELEPEPEPESEPEPDFPESIFPAVPGEANVAFDDDEEPEPEPDEE